MAILAANCFWQEDLKDENGHFLKHEKLESRWSSCNGSAGDVIVSRPRLAQLWLVNKP